MSSKICDTRYRAYHFLSAGTTYHGLCFVDVARMTDWYVFMYSSQYARSLRSLAENFQFFVSSSMRARKRSFCVSFETLRKIFTTRNPFSYRYSSKSLIWR